MNKFSEYTVGTRKPVMYHVERSDTFSQKRQSLGHNRLHEEDETLLSAPHSDHHTVINVRENLIAMYLAKVQLYQYCTKSPVQTEAIEKQSGHLLNSLFIA